MAFDDATRAGHEEALVASGTGTSAKPSRGCRECLWNTIPCLRPSAGTRRPSFDGSSGALFASPGASTHKKAEPVATISTIQGVDETPLLNSVSGGMSSGMTGGMTSGMLSGGMSGMKKSESGQHLVSAVLGTCEDEEDEFDGPLLAPWLNPSSGEDDNLVLNRKSISEGHSSGHATVNALGTPQRRTQKRSSVASLFAAGGGAPLPTEHLPTVQEPADDISMGAVSSNRQDVTQLKSTKHSSAPALGKPPAEQPMSAPKVGRIPKMLKPLMTGDENPLDVQFSPGPQASPRPLPSPRGNQV